MQETDGIKALVSQFQLETRSCNVLEFITWLDNRMIYAKNNKIPSREDLAKRIVEELTRPKQPVDNNNNINNTEKNNSPSI